MYRASKNNNFRTSFGRGLLQGNFLKFWVWKKLHDVKCCFAMTSLVISRLSCFRLTENRLKRSSMKVLFYLLSSWLSPNGTSVFSFWIQNFFLSLTFLAVLLWRRVNLPLCQWWWIWHVCWNYVLFPENVCRLEWN